MRKRHVHLGERLAALDRVRAGASVGAVARELGVTAEVVGEWQRRHAGEATVSLAQLRRARSPEEERLAERVRRLAALLAEADRELRSLHEEHIRSLPASNEELVPEASNEAFEAEPGARSSKKLG